MILVELEQPFAEMVVRDLINVLHLKRRVERMTREVVIYARKPRKNSAIPLEWMHPPTPKLSFPLSPYLPRISAICWAK